MATTFPSNSYGEMIVNTPGVLSYWRMGNQGQVRDDVGTFHGIEWNNPVVSTGALAGDGDGSTYFDGNDYLNVNNVYDFGGNSQFSIEVWIRPTIVPASGYFPTFISKENYDTSPASGYGFYLEPNTNRVIFARMGQSGQGRVYTAQNLPTNSWTHLVVTYNGYELKLYRNGTYDWNTGHNTPAATSTAFLKFGVSAPNFNTDFFTGYIDEIAFYNVELSQATIQSHYSKGTNAPILYYSLSDYDTLSASESRGFLLARTLNDSAFLRSTETESAASTGLSRSDAGTIGASEARTIDITFAGSRLDDTQQHVVSAVENIAPAASMSLFEYTPAVLGSFVLGSDRLTDGVGLRSTFDVSEAKEQAASINLNVPQTLNSTEVTTVREMVQLNHDFPTVASRVQGFIHFAAEKATSGPIVIEHRHEDIVPKADWNDVYGVARYGMNVYRDPIEGVSTSVETVTTFAIRRPSDFLVAVGVCQVNWTTGLIMVDIFTKDYQNPDLFAFYAKPSEG